MKTVSKIIFSTAIALCMAFNSNAQTSMDYNIMVEDIEFQTGVTIDINVNVYVNENATNWANHGKIFAIEGMVHAANCWKPLAEELFLNGPNGAHLNEFYAIDMPGKGLSGLPEGGDFLFEDLYLEDYLSIIRGVLSYLNDDGIYPTTIMGHSLAGLEVMMLQQQLIDEGTNLRQEFRIKNAILLAPAPPAGCPWYFLDSGMAELRLGPFAHYIEGRGLSLDIPLMFWPYNFFTNPFYQPPAMVPGAPTHTQVAMNGYIGLEPAPLVYQSGGQQIPEILGTYPFKPRPVIDPLIFKPNHGVQLTVVADEFDLLMNPAEMEFVYEHLTGDTKHKRYFVVLGDHTCHDTHISDPHAVVELLNTPSIFKSSEIAEDVVTTCNVSVYPNPVQSNSTIEVELAQNANLELCIYNQVGQLIETLYNGHMEKGNHTFQLAAEKLPVGLYTLLVQNGDKSEVIKIVKIK